MQKLTPILVATLALIGSISCAPNPAKPGTTLVLGDSFDVPNDDLHNVDSNNILPYDPVDPKPTRVVVPIIQRGQTKEIQSSSYTNLERESSNTRKQPTVANVMAQGDDAERSGSPNVDKIKDIAMNSREVRLVGPNQKEVEMRDDLPTKVVVALENLQKEAQEVLSQMNDKLDKGWTEIKRSEVWGQVNDKLDKGWTEIKSSEVWGQVNEKLDKGWTDLKSMVEGVVSPTSKSG